MNGSRRQFIWAALGAAMLPACRKADPGTASVTPVEIDPQSTCSLDGMLLADYPGSKAQIHYAGEAAPAFFCDTVEMFHALMRPEQVKKVRAAFVQDMSQADWNNPQGHWIDALKAFYVHGSQRKGSMGPTLVPFARQADAAVFITGNGGQVVAYADVKPDLVNLCGGASHDSRM